MRSDQRECGACRANGREAKYTYAVAVAERMAAQVRQPAVVIGQVRSKLLQPFGPKHASMEQTTKFQANRFHVNGSRLSKVMNLTAPKQDHAKVFAFICVGRLVGAGIAQERCLVERTQQWHSGGFSGGGGGSFGNCLDLEHDGAHQNFAVEDVFALGCIQQGL